MSPSSHECWRLLRTVKGIWVWIRTHHNVNTKSKISCWQSYAPTKLLPRIQTSSNGGDDYICVVKWCTKPQKLRINILMTAGPKWHHETKAAPWWLAAVGPDTAPLPSLTMLPWSQTGNSLSPTTTSFLMEPMIKCFTSRLLWVKCHLKNKKKISKFRFSTVRFSLERFSG